ncbi:hypothetical protein GpartN1_g643.t1 [Galdieria partita]|uniref:Uncharacterized protein n=1 Tax=Galdieria partita TaxID=83374 RepID=A0A9C7PRV8_9RHOD|nr:hypothetical protein GpartN1_g643.t1 [Galdieria partita]
MIIVFYLPCLSFGKVVQPFLVSSKLPTFWIEDITLEEEDTCWQALSRGISIPDQRAKKLGLVFTLNQNLADISSAKVLPGLKRHGINALFLVDSSSIVSNENILRNIVEQGHYVAIKNISENASKEEIMGDVDVYYRVLEQTPLFVAQKSAITVPVEIPVKMMPIYVGQYDGRAISLEREGDLEDAISQISEISSSFTTLEKMMNLEQLRCTYQKVGCHCRKIRESMFSKWCTNLEEELISRYISFAEYVSIERNFTSQKVKGWLNDVHFFVQRNSEKLESLYESWRYADTAAERTTSIIHLWPKRRIPPISSVNSSCLRKSLQLYKQKSSINYIFDDVHVLIDISALLMLLLLFWLRRKHLQIKKQD